MKLGLLASLSLIAVIGQNRTLATEPPPIESAVLMELSEADRVALVMAALRRREDQLQNFSCELEETVGNVNLKNGSRTAVRKSRFSVKRHGDKIYLQGQRFSTEAVKESEFRISWDGSREISITEPVGDDPGRGNVRDSQLPIFGEIAFNQMVGVRMVAEPQTMVDWLATQVSDRRGRVEVTTERDGKVIRVKVDKGGFIHQLWLDSAQEFAPVEYTYHDGGNWERHHVTEARRVDGLSVPMRVTRRSGTDATPGVETEMVYAAISFTRGTASAADFEIKFPPGMPVVDSIRKVAFRLNADGSEQMLPLYDPKIGKVTVNGQPMAGAGGTAASLAAARVSAPVAAPPPAKQSEKVVLSVGQWLLAGGGIAAVVGGIVVLVRELRGRRHARS